MLQNAQKVIGKQVKLRTQFYSRNRVDLINGRASFVDMHRLEIRGNKSVETIHFKQAIIATGSRPYLPPDVDFRHHRIYNSDSILNLSHTPRTLIIYGAEIGRAHV